ncbi:MAG: hypothetical protein H7Z41_16020, partial [Cytophagales bacterium]|nr:hypothetical protein [Armatimonadota bacterium]
HDRYLLNAVTTKTLGFTGTGSAVVVEGNYAAWREATQAMPAAKEKKVAAPAPPSAPVPAAASSPKPPPPFSGNARDLSKARIKAHEAVTKAERAVQTQESALADVETALASGGNGTDHVALAAEHTRLRGAVEAAVAAWERAVSEQEVLA